MARNRSNKPATAADIKRLVDATTAAKSTKRNRKSSRQNNRGSQDAPGAIGTTNYTRGPTGSVTRVANTEFIADLAAGGAILSWDLNPASGSLFTWLARIASGFEFFRFTKLQFIYTPICSSSTSGVVVLAPDYDASDPNPTSKQSLTAYSGSARTNVWNRLVCDVKPPKGWYFVGNNTGNVNPVNTDVKFYDIAKFYAGIFNSSGNQVTGELAVTYECEFAKPDFGPIPYPGELIAFNSASVANPTSGMTMSGNYPVVVANPIAGSFTMTFPSAGQFVLELRDNMRSSVSITNAWQAPLQTDPGSTTSVPLTYMDTMTTGWVNATTDYGHLALVYTNVIAGTVLTFSLNTSVTLLSYFIMRILSYTKSAG